MSLGFYARIPEYDVVKERVFHYVEVMARPMVMYQNDHPIQWTSAYVGGKVRPNDFFFLEIVIFIFAYRLIHLLKAEVDS